MLAFAEPLRNAQLWCARLRAVMRGPHLMPDNRTAMVEADAVAGAMTLSRTNEARPTCDQGSPRRADVGIM